MWLCMGVSTRGGGSPVVTGVSLFNYNDTTYDARDSSIILNISGRNFGPARLGSSSLVVTLEPDVNDTTGTVPINCPFVPFGDFNIRCEVRSREQIHAGHVRLCSKEWNMWC